MYGTTLRKALIATTLTLAAFGAAAATPDQIEASLVLKGTLDIAADGRVMGYALDDSEKLPDSVRRLAAQAIPQWQFEPVALDPGTTIGRAHMNLRVVAKKLPDGALALRIAGAQFGSSIPADAPRAERMTPPRYPDAAARAGVGGEVYTVLRIGQDGTVVDAVAEQVNLFVLDRPNAMTAWRNLLAKTAVAQARHWKFVPPAQVAGSEVTSWSVRVPVDFIAPGMDEPQPWQWRAYVPGPRSAIPWDREASQEAADAVASGGVFPLHSPYKLLTPLATSF